MMSRTRTVLLVLLLSIVALPVMAEAIPPADTPANATPEVKVRSGANPEPLIEARRPQRRARLSLAARVWLAHLHPPLPLLRFDVMLVTPDPAEPLGPALHLFGDCWRPGWDGRQNRSGSAG